jgi:AcrR family transcriptional regulator
MIIASATAAFLERGYVGSTMAHIAMASDSSKQTIYNQFGGKEQLFEAVLSSIWSGLDTVPTSAADAASQSARTVLSSLGSAIAEFWDHSAILPFLRMVVAEAPRFPDLQRMFHAAATKRILSSVRSALLALSARDLLRLSDVNLAALQWMGLINEPLLWPRLIDLEYRPPPASQRHVVAQAVDIFLSYYGACGRAASHDMSSQGTSFGAPTS